MKDLSANEMDELEWTSKVLYSSLFILECATTGDIETEKEIIYPFISDLTTKALKLKEIINKI